MWDSWRESRRAGARAVPAVRVGTVLRDVGQPPERLLVPRRYDDLAHLLGHEQRRAACGVLTYADQGLLALRLDDELDGRPPVGYSWACSFSRRGGSLSSDTVWSLTTAGHSPAEWCSLAPGGGPRLAYRPHP